MKLVAILAVLVARYGAAAEPIQIDSITRQNPQQHLYVARIDLTDPRVSIVMANGGPDPDGTGHWETVLRQPSITAKANDFALAINTVFFSHLAPDGDLKKYAAGEPAAGQNTVVIDGKTVTKTGGAALLAFDRQNRARIGLVDGQLPANTWQAAAGSMQIVTGGKNTAPDDDDRHPRTAAGITADGHTLVLLVADGRRAGWALGLTIRELANEMLAQGCRDAVNFDGGGSSTLIARQPDGKLKVLNTPSDGSTFLIPLSIERPVAYVLGVKVKTNQ